MIETQTEPPLSLQLPFLLLCANTQYTTALAVCAGDNLQQLKLFRPTDNAADLPFVCPLQWELVSVICELNIYLEMELWIHA